MITDHSSLKWLMSNKELSGRLARWSLLLQSYTFDIEHRQGSKNIVPDILSRYDIDEIVAVVNEFIDLKSPEFKDSTNLDLIACIRENEKLLPDLRVEDEYVYKRTCQYNGDERLRIFHGSYGFHRG